MRLELLYKLLALTKKQEELINQEEVEKYIEIIEQRQNIMDEIDHINARDPQPLSNDERQTLLEIKQLDDKNAEEFQKQFEEVKEKLRGMRMSMQKTNYYNNPYNAAQEEGLFIDKRNGIMKKYRR